MAEPKNPAPNQPDVEKILSTIRQIESGGNYGAKAKGSSASGAYQFINDTWQRSTKGAGVGTEYKTAGDAPPEVQDAVAAWAVKDILGKVGGDVTKVPLVWYTGNPQGRITEEALRINKGLKPDQYQQKWLSVFNRGQQAQPQAVAQAPRTTAQPMKVAQAAAPSLTDMPPSYRMALAANYLADTESPETSVLERAMEMINEQQGGARKNPLAGFTQALGEESVNPFQFVQQPPEEERRRAVPRMPVRMKDGGDAKKEEFDQQKEQERQLRLIEQGLSYAMGPMNIRAVRKPEGYETRVSGRFNQVVPYMDFDPLTGTFKPTEVGVSYGQMGPEGGYLFQYGQPLPREGQRPTPPQVTGQYRRQLDRNSEIQASGYYVPIPGAKDQYGAQFRYLQRFADGGQANKGGEVVYRQSGSPEQGEVANPADIAEQMTVGTLPEGQKPAGQVFRDIGRDVVRGAQYLPYDLLGAPVDIATMAMRPFGYNVEKPFLGSEYLIDKAAQAGIANRPTGSAAETTTRIGMGFINPAAGARQVGRGIEAIERGAETLGTGAVRAITGKPDITPEQIYQAMAEPKGIMQLGAPAIVKPKGGTFVSGKFSNFDHALDAMSDALYGRKQAYRYVQGGEEDIKKIDEVDNFFKSKFKNYYQKKLGSQNDPLREAFIRGDFNGSDWFNAEEIAGLREVATDPTNVGSVARKQALDELNRKYDAWTDIAAVFPEVNTMADVNNFNMRTKSGKLETSPLNLYSERALDRLREQGANIRSTDLAYSVDTKPISDFDPRAVNALKEKDLVYDVGSTATLQDRMVSIRDYLMTLNPNQIKNITFEDAIIGAERYHEALKNPVKKFTPEQLFEGREKLFQPSEKYQWSEIKTEDALRREGDVMNHCIGGDTYCKDLTSGVGKHFSLQDAETGIPHTTLSIYRSPFAPPNSKHVVIEQIKGNSNSAPTKYFKEIEKFLEDYEKRVGKIYITEDRGHIPPAFKGPEYTELPRGYQGNQYAKGGMVDKPLYDRAT